MGSAIRQKLSDDLKRALKARDTLRCNTIRFLLSDINYAEIAKQAPLEDPDVLGVIAREIRQHRESIDAFRQGKREDLASREEAELAILQSYLPEQLSREELAAAAGDVIREVGAQGMKDKGKVMSQLMPRVKGKAEGRVINEVVTELLSK